MKTKVCAAICFLFVLRFTSHAQTDTVSKYSARYYISLNAGLATPSGAFGSNSYPSFGDPGNGFAGNIYGFVAKQNYVTGFAAMINYYFNPATLSDQSFGNPITKTGYYAEVAPMLGLCWDIPVRKWFLDFRCMLGPGFSIISSASYSNYYGSNTYFDPIWSCSISGDLGIGFRYPLGKNLSLSFFADDFWTGANYRSYENDINIYADIALSNFTLGITYNVGEYVHPAPYVPSFVDSLQMDSVPKDTMKEPNPKAYLYLMGGVNNPGPKFRAGNSSVVDGADDGNSYCFSANIPIKHSNKGIAFMVGGGYNSFSTEDFGRQGDAAGNILIANFTTPSNFTETYGMLGAYITIPANNVLSFDFKALMGGLYYTTPGYSYSAYQTNPALQYSPPLYTKNMASYSSVTLVFDIAASMKFNFLKRFYLALNLDIINTPFDVIAINNETIGLGVRL
jgi:hypothetical protein